MNLEIHYVLCPQCHSVASYTLNNREGEIRILCPVCGFYYRRTPILDSKAIAKKPGETIYKFSNNGLPIYQIYQKKGQGVYLYTDNGEAILKSCNPYLEKNAIEGILNLSKLDSEIKLIYVTNWNYISREVEVIYGTIKNPVMEGIAFTYYK